MRRFLLALLPLVLGACLLDDVSLEGKHCELPDHPCVTGFMCVDGVCQHCADLDHDGVLPIECGGGDCDDADADVNPQAQEDCQNGHDDDCNGFTDSEDPACQCTTGETRACESSCPGSLSRCVSGAFGACLPPTETCNGQDDDCNGTKDDGFQCVLGEARGCTTSCGTQGRQTCGSGCVWSACVPPAETCNGQDDDCNGLPDDGFDCVAGATLTCLTSCGTQGTALCDATCHAPASCAAPAETCNGKDDDCDGEVDDGFQCSPGARSQTACDFSVGSCHAASMLACNDQCGGFDVCVKPVERCNGLDDDCDGAIDQALRADAVGLESSVSAVAIGAGNGLVARAIVRAGKLSVELAHSGAAARPTVVRTVSLQANASATARDPQVAMGNTALGVVWVESSGGSDALYFSRIPLDGSPASTPAVLGSPGASIRPRIAYTSEAGGRFGISSIGAMGAELAIQPELSGGAPIAMHSLTSVSSTAKFVGIAPKSGSSGGFVIVVPAAASGGAIRPDLWAISASGQLTGGAQTLSAQVSGQSHDEGVELAAAGSFLHAAWTVDMYVDAQTVQTVVVASSWAVTQAPAVASAVSPGGAHVAGNVRIAALAEAPAVGMSAATSPVLAVVWTELDDLGTHLVAASRVQGSAPRVHALDEQSSSYVAQGLALTGNVACDGANFWFTWIDNDVAALRQLCP